MQRGALQTEWGSSDDERVKQILRVPGKLDARDLVVAEQGDR